RAPLRSARRPARSRRPPDRASAPCRRAGARGPEAAARRRARAVRPPDRLRPRGRRRHPRAESSGAKALSRRSPNRRSSCRAQASSLLPVLDAPERSSVGSGGGPMQAGYWSAAANPGYPFSPPRSVDRQERMTRSRYGLRPYAAGTWCFILAGAIAATSARGDESVAPFVPTVEEDVELMLEVGDVGPGDYVIDLGSGDGRIVIEAAKRGARGHGAELEPELVEPSNAHARA